LLPSPGQHGAHGQQATGRIVGAAALFGGELEVRQFTGIHQQQTAGDDQERRCQAMVSDTWPGSRFEHTAITTGSVPMIIVGSSTPAFWIALASSA
jgi:hypothetical protein